MRETKRLSKKTVMFIYFVLFPITAITSYLYFEALVFWSVAWLVTAIYWLVNDYQ